MRAVALVLLLATSTNAALRGGKRDLKKGNKKGEGPCGNLSAELQAAWAIPDVACIQAEEQRDDPCQAGPVNFGGECQTSEDCSVVNPLESCIIVRDLTNSMGVTTVCGTVADVALEYETGSIQEYAMMKVCAAQNIET